VLALGTIGLAGGLTGLTGLTGCTAEQTPAAPQPLEPDELAVNRAVSAAQALRAQAGALAQARPQLATLLGRIAKVHEQHLTALGSPIAAPSTTGSTSESTSAPSPTASDAAATPTALIKAELAAARTALRDGEAAAPLFAVLLCRIAAARVVNADLLSTAAGRKLPGALRPESSETGPTPTAGASGTDAATPTGETDPNDPADLGEPVDLADLAAPETPAQIALDRLLAGEHAAVFAYPLIVARSDAGRRALASALWQVHRNERDEFSIQLIRAGIRPSVAEPAYDVGTPPASGAKAAALAGRVESGLAALAADLLAAGAAGDANRVLGADQLVLAARRTASWTGKPLSFPGQARA
jgi:hypothetical protein